MAPSSISKARAVVAPKSPAAPGAEKARLDQLKKTYKAQLAGKAPAELRTEAAAQDKRLASAKQALREVKTSGTPAQIAAKERALRTEYARSSVVKALLPVRLDRAAMHEYADSLKPKSVKQLHAERARLEAAYAAMTSGASRASRSERYHQEVRLAIVDQAIARKVGAPPSVKAVDPTRNPGNVVFEGPGMFVERPEGFRAADWAAKMKAAGVTWISLQVHNPGPVGKSVEALDAGWAQEWKAAGFKVGFWGVSYDGNTEQDAAHGAQLSQKYGADFYIANCEGFFQDGQGDVGRNKRFVDAFQAEASRLGIGDIPRALSSMGRVALDMKPWIDNGWDALPQTYWNSYEVYEPAANVQFWRDWGWPQGRVHPTIATYTGEGTQTAVKGVLDYLPRLQAAGTTGFSYYLPENYLDDQQYAQLLQARKLGMK